MGRILSSEKWRMTWQRWALITVPAIVVLGMLSGLLSNSGYGNPWFDSLAKPAIMPPGWVFPVAWTTFYIMMGLAVAMILAAPRTKGRDVALIFFLGQLGLNLSWSPIFFAQHKVMLAFGVILAMIAWAGIATIVFAYIRRTAAWLMLPYLLWLLFAATLNWQIHILNPSNGALVGPVTNTQIIVQ